MPKFSYGAMDSRGKENKGTLEVSNQNEAITRVKEMGSLPHGKLSRSKRKKPDKKADKKSKTASYQTRSQEEKGGMVNYPDQDSRSSADG